MRERKALPASASQPLTGEVKGAPPKKMHLNQMISESILLSPGWDEKYAEAMVQEQDRFDLNSAGFQLQTCLQPCYCGLMKSNACIPVSLAYKNGKIVCNKDTDEEDYVESTDQADAMSYALMQYNQKDVKFFGSGLAGFLEFLGESIAEETRANANEETKNA